MERKNSQFADQFYPCHAEELNSRLIFLIKSGRRRRESRLRIREKQNSLNYMALYGVFEKCKIKLQ
jgi:hypothetical protein